MERARLRPLSHTLRTPLFKPQVFGFTRFGAYASHVVVPELYCRKLPPGWTFEQGASFVVQGLTAWHGLVELGGCKPGAGQTVLVHSAAGGVGALALELCEKLKAFPIATIGSEAKVCMVMGWGGRWIPIYLSVVTSSCHAKALFHSFALSLQHRRPTTTTNKRPK